MSTTITNNISFSDDDDSDDNDNDNNNGSGVANDDFLRYTPESQASTTTNDDTAVARSNALVLDDSEDEEGDINITTSSTLVPQTLGVSLAASTSRAIALSSSSSSVVVAIGDDDDDDDDEQDDEAMDFEVTAPTSTSTYSAPTNIDGTTLPHKTPSFGIGSTLEQPSRDANTASRPSTLATSTEVHFDDLEDDEDQDTTVDLSETINITGLLDSNNSNSTTSVIDYSPTRLARVQTDAKCEQSAYFEYFGGIRLPKLVGRAQEMQYILSHCALVCHKEQESELRVIA
jgi:hypothetical protein